MTGDHSCGSPLMSIGKPTRRRSPGARSSTVIACSDTSPAGETSCAVRPTSRVSSLWLTSQPSVRAIAEQSVPSQATSERTPTSSHSTRPTGSSVTGRVIPPQFHQPSRSSALRSFETRTTRSLTWPAGRSPSAGSVNGSNCARWRPSLRPLSQTVASRRTPAKCSAQPNPAGANGVLSRIRYQAIVPRNWSSIGSALKTCGTVTSCQSSSQRPDCQPPSRPASSGSNLISQPVSSATARGGPSPRVAFEAGAAIARKASRVTKVRRRGSSTTRRG